MRERAADIFTKQREIAAKMKSAPGAPRILDISGKMWSRRRDKPPPPTGTTGILPVEIVFNAETRNRPLRVGATHREATKPSEARAESRRETVGRGVSPVDNWDNGRLARCEWKSGKVRRSVDFAYSTTLYPTNGDPMAFIERVLIRLDGLPARSTPPG